MTTKQDHGTARCSICGREAKRAGKDQPPPAPWCGGWTGTFPGGYYILCPSTACDKEFKKKCKGGK